MKPEETDWLAAVGHNQWITTKPLVYHYLGFTITVPAGFRTDLFSVVPNTGHPEMWRAAILHDYMRQSARYSRLFADACFLLDMIRAGLSIYSRLKARDEKRAEKELKRALRVAALYYLGVSGIVGSVYIGFQRIGGWFKKAF